jgi:hypothetical protein
VSGVQPLTFSNVGYFANITVNLAANSEWIGSYSGNPGTVDHINGPGLFDASGASGVLGTAIIASNVIGTGTISQVSSHSQGKLGILAFRWGGADG